LTKYAIIYIRHTTKEEKVRIGINVPDELLKRIEPLKTVTNVSQICRDAIKTHVETYERAMARAKQDGMEAIAERLGSMLVPQEVDWELLGIEDAKMWVQLAKLEDFENLLHRLEVLKRQGRSPYEVPIPRVQGVKFFEEQSYEHDEWFDRQVEVNEEKNPYIEAKLEYQRGKLSYILAVWNMAKEIAKEQYKTESITREHARREARNRIKVPDHLIESSK
jgi:hypothetical protein